MSITQRIKALDSAPHWLARAPHRVRWREERLHTGRTFAELVAEGVAASPDARLVFGSLERPSETTTSQLYEESHAIATGLMRLGLREGDALVAQIPSWREGALILLAAVRLGLLFVPVIHTYGAAELTFILRTTNAKALVVPGRWKKIDYGARVRALGELPDLAHVVAIGEHDIRGATDWDALARTPPEPLPKLTAAPDDGWLVLFTSGTTASPKGVVHTHHTFGCEVGLFPNVVSPVKRPMLMPLPGGHMAGLLFMLRPFLLADPGIMMDAFDEALAIDLIRRYRPDRAGGVPFMVDIFLAHAAELFPDGLRQMTVGAASVPASLMDRCEALGWPGTRTYGLTEHPTITGGFPSDPAAKRTRSDGRALAGVQVRLVDEDGREVPCGTPGEIVSMGPELCKGYLDPAHNEASFAKDGWFHTGDIGVRDADGYVAIVDRKKDIIIRGGENISSKEVEDVLSRHPSVAEVAVVAWPDPRLGERVGAFVRLKASAAAPSIAEVTEHFARAGVSRQKTPERLIVVDDFPRTPTGKVIKPELRARLREIAERGNA